MVNVKRTVIMSLAGILGAAALSGCATDQGPVAGVIVEPQEQSVGRDAPDFALVTAEGKSTTFHKIREPIAIVAFVSPAGAQCCWLNPKLASLAEDLRYRRITVIQISEPTEKCTHGPGCVTACNLKAPYLVSLCDAKHIAWHAYRKPKPNTVVLINYRGEVAQIGRLGELGTVATKARRLATEAEAWWQSAYAN